MHVSRTCALAKSYASSWTPKLCIFALLALESFGPVVADSNGGRLVVWCVSHLFSEAGGAIEIYPLLPAW